MRIFLETCTPFARKVLCTAHREEGCWITPESFFAAFLEVEKLDSSITNIQDLLDAAQHVMRPSYAEKGDDDGGDARSVSEVRGNNEFEEMVRAGFSIVGATGRTQIAVGDILVAMLSISGTIQACFSYANFDESAVERFLHEVYDVEGLGYAVETLAVEVHTEAHDSGEKGEERNKAELIRNAFCPVYAPSADKVVGRDTEVTAILNILHRKDKSSALLLGDSGVGKTWVIDAVVHTITSASALYANSVLKLDTMRVMSDVTYGGQLESKLDAIFNALDELANPILVIDGIAELVNANPHLGSSPIQVLKEMLDKHTVRCICTITNNDFHAWVERDAAFLNRFSMVCIEEPSAKQCMDMVNAVLPTYEAFHRVQFTKAAIAEVIRLTGKYDHEHCFPAKAVDFIDLVGSIYSSVSEKSKTKITPEMIVKQFSEQSGLPADSLLVDEAARLKSLERELNKVVFGQQTAIKKCVDAIKISRTGLNGENKPIASFLFVGQTGVGKTEVAKQLAKSLGIAFIRFDMSEYADQTAVNKLVGSNAGYVGYSEGGLLTNEVRKSPNAVVLFDEIEKAHPSVYNLLLQVMDDARLTDNKGNVADFHNTIIIMTSNAGATGVVTNGLGFGKSTKVVNFDAMDKAVEMTFTPEFRNRLTAVIKFNSVNNDMLKHIAEKELRNLTKLMRSKGIQLQFSSSVSDRLCQGGLSQEFGARELLRAFDNEIKLPIANGMVNGKVTKGNKYLLNVKDEQLAINRIVKQEEEQW